MVFHTLVNIPMFLELLSISSSTYCDVCVFLEIFPGMLSLKLCSRRTGGRRHPYLG